MSSSSLPPERPVERVERVEHGEQAARAHARPMPVEVIDACRDALNAYAGDPASLDGIRTAIHSLAAAARRHAVSPEQMLIELKAMLAEAPALRDLPAPRVHAARAKLVSAAIRAYYDVQDT